MNLEIFKVAIKGHKCLQRKEKKRIPLGRGPLDGIHVKFSDNIWFKKKKISKEFYGFKKLQSTHYYKRLSKM
jgi:hypothetical protein